MDGANAIAERQSVADRGVGRERVDRGFRPQVRDRLRRVAGLREHHQRLRLQPLRDETRGLRHCVRFVVWMLDVERRLGRLCLQRDAAHRRYGFHGVLPDSRLLGEHHRVGAVEDRVGDVARLCPRRDGAVHHRSQHLGSCDDRLPCLVRLADDELLQQWHPFRRDLHAKVAPRDHDAVRLFDDLIEVLDRHRMLYLRDDGRRRPHLL